MEINNTPILKILSVMHEDFKMYSEFNCTLFFSFSRIDLQEIRPLECLAWSYTSTKAKNWWIPIFRKIVDNICSSWQLDIIWWRVDPPPIISETTGFMTMNEIFTRCQGFYDGTKNLTAIIWSLNNSPHCEKLNFWKCNF